MTGFLLLPCAERELACVREAALETVLEPKAGGGISSSSIPAPVSSVMSTTAGGGELRVAFADLCASLIEFCCA